MVGHHAYGPEGGRTSLHRVLTDLEPSDPAARLARERDRVVERLRSLPEARLTRAGADGRSLLDAARHAARALADLAAEAEGHAHRELPVLHPLATGDLVAVTATDLLTSGAAPEVLARGADLLAALRRVS